MKILLPIDGSDCSMSTLQWAADTLDKATTDYYLLFIIAVLPDLDTAAYDTPFAEELLQRSKDALEKAGCRVVKTEYIIGDPVHQICQYADSIRADQIIVGSHGRKGLAKLLMGNVSTQVLEHCQCPVTIHREGKTQPAGGK